MVDLVLADLLLLAMDDAIVELLTGKADSERRFLQRMGWLRMADVVVSSS